MRPSTCRFGCRAAGCATIATKPRRTTFFLGAASGTMWGAFAVAHGVTGSVEADVEEESKEAEEDGSKMDESADEAEAQPRRLDTQTVRTRPPKTARLCNSDVLLYLYPFVVHDFCLP